MGVNNDEGPLFYMSFDTTGLTMSWITKDNKVTQDLLDAKTFTLMEVHEYKSKEQGRVTSHNKAKIDAIAIMSVAKVLVGDH